MIQISRTIDLTKPVQVEKLSGYLFTGESDGHQFLFDFTPDTEGHLSAYFIRANNTTIVIDGSEHTITLPQDCYNVQGRFQLAVFATLTGGGSTCVYAAVGTITKSRTDDMIDSGDAVPTLDDILAQVENCREAATLAYAAAVASGLPAAQALVNEVKCLSVNCGTISSLPRTVTNTLIASDMVVINSTLGTPSAQTSDWTVTTSAGTLTISGSISGSTTVTLYLMKSR